MEYCDPLHFLKFKRGEDLPQSKLTVEKVIEARKLHAEYIDTVKKLQDEFSIKGLARRYGVHHATMEKAISGITWSHVP